MFYFKQIQNLTLRTFHLFIVNVLPLWVSPESFLLLLYIFLALVFKNDKQDWSFIRIFADCFSENRLIIYHDCVLRD